MQLRYVVPGVLALVGCWWWYTSRKKAQITSQDNEETQAMESSCQDKPNADEERPSDQEVTVQVHAPATKTSAGEPVGSPDTVMASGQLGSPSCSSATTGSQQNSPETIRQNPPVSTSTPSTVIEKCSHNRPEAAAVSTESSHLPTGDKLDSATQPQDQTVDKQEPDTKKIAPTVSSDVELSKAELPESEVEVAVDISAVPFADNVQEDLVKDSLSFTRDDLSSTTTTAVDQCAQSVFGYSVGPESPMGSSFLPSASTHVSDASVEPQHHENGDISWPADTSKNMEELQHFVAGLITEVITVGQQEVMDVSSCRTSEAASSSTPTLNDKETTRDKDLHASHVGSSSPSNTDDIQEHPAQIMKEVINGFLTHFVGEKAKDKQECLVSSKGQLESALVLPKLQAEEAISATKDSECSTCQSEDGMSSKDLLSSTGLSSAVPECTEDLLECLGYSISSDKKEDGLQESSDVSVEEKPALTREHVAAASEAELLNRTGLNGTIEEEAEQSRGSDVNSMGSVGTLETGSGQQSSSQASLSQSSEPIKWEVEVPKHLVSRLIGQQGKYVIFLKQRSGAEIYIITLPHTKEFEICHIEGTQQQVDKALALIGKKFRNLDLTNKYAPPPLPSQLMMNWQSGSQASLSQSSELIQLDFEVPKHLVSRLIGKQGKYVNFLKQSSGAEVYVTTLPYTKEFEICRVKGTQQQVDKAMALIGKKFRNLDLTSLHAHVGPGEHRGGSQQTPCAVLRHDPKSHSLYC
ncbi:uncharacterized protein [Salminus brasiliensis]|uniref:uncharacterized protein n=1 Tax=Salminus brasiliensis TaxID=930266 RepID=UPI003B8309AF